MAKISVLLSILSLLETSLFVCSLASNNRKAFAQLPRPESPLAVEEFYQQRPHSYDYVIGSDETGVGCIAGPIICVSCCILLDGTDEKKALGDLPIGVQDGKQLSVDECRSIYQYVQQRHAKDDKMVRYTVTIRSAAEIDAADSITDACMDAFAESIQSLATSLPPRGRTTSFYSIVDGHKSPPRMMLNTTDPTTITSRPWKHADTVVYSVALASCIARAIHSTGEHGVFAYPTRHHLALMDQNGVTPHHRRSCKPVRDRLALPRREWMWMSLFMVTATAGMVPPVEPAAAMTRERGMLLPEPGEVETAVERLVKDGDLLLPEAEPLRRLDGADDAIFYDTPRLVEHIDTAAVQRLTEYQSTQVLLQSNKNQQQPTATTVLDVGASWTSHLKLASATNPVVLWGIGMNKDELAANTLLQKWWVQDLNVVPKLPFLPDASCDMVVCQLTIDYLTRPLAVCRELFRVLKVGGTVHVSFSNRLFLQKAVDNWTGRDDVEHVEIVASYLLSAGFQDVRAVDLSIRKPRSGSIVGDPLYVVRGRKHEK